MSKMIQLRHVPDGLHRQLKARAALEGLTLSDFLIREARKIAARPTAAEIHARLAHAANARDAEHHSRRCGSPRAGAALIVLDASAARELLLQTPLGISVATRALAADESLHAPHLLEIEVTQVLRRYARWRAAGRACRAGAK